jgi:hypothetical protein
MLVFAVTFLVFCHNESQDFYFNQNAKTIPISFQLRRLGAVP